MKKFLVVSPHPDDLDFCCAGTMAKLVKEGNRVEELIVSDGSKGNHVAGFYGKRLAKIREQEQKAAAKALGIAKVHFLREVDGKLENTKKLCKKLVVAIRAIKPDVVLSFDPVALNAFERPGLSHRDHRQVAEAVFDAIYPAVGNTSFFPELIKRGLKPHQVKEIWFFAPQKPNKFVDISKAFPLKIKALRSHASQIKDSSYVESFMKDWARETGKKKGMKYAEGFRVVGLG